MLKGSLNARSHDAGQPVQKLILLSFIVATVALPTIASRRRDADFKKALWWMVLFNLFYLFCLVFVWKHLL